MSSSKQKTNADFRRLMMTPKPSREGEEESEVYKRRGKSGRSRIDVPSKPKPAKRPRKKRHKPKENALGGKYRDRASERRKGVNPDYEEVQAEMLDSGFGENEDDSGESNNISIEDSKFLGGDLKHTHLVKGLDYTLLAQIRSDIEKDSEEILQKDTEEKKDESGEISFRTHLAHSLYRTLFERDEEKVTATKEAFLPGRTTLIFNVDYEDTQQLIPTMLVRSKEDCPQRECYVETVIQPDIVNTIANVMEYIEQGKIERRRRKKEKQKKLLGGRGGGKDDKHKTKILEDDIFDEDDIFADAGGDYVFEPTTTTITHPEVGKLDEKKNKTIYEKEAQAGKEAYFAVPAPVSKQSHLPTYKEEGEGEGKEDGNEEKGGEEEMKLENITDLQGPVMPTAGSDSYDAYPEVGAAYPEVGMAYPPPGRTMVQGYPDASSGEVGRYPQMTTGMVYPSPGMAQGYPSGYPNPQAVAGYLQDVHATGYPGMVVNPYTTPQAPPLPTQQHPSELLDSLNSSKDLTAGVVKVALKETEMSKQEERDAGLATVFKRDDNALRRRGKIDKREMDPSFVSDSYSECYPGTYEMTAFAFEEEEEEEDLSKMDQGTRARKKIRPWHFKSDEAWDKYQETMEATPKAAFQFGVKMSGGRRKSLKQKKKTAEAKFNREYNKINKLLKEQGVYGK